MSLVSVVIPSYGRPDYLERLLRSIREQRFPDAEVVVVDDNSPEVEGYQRVIDRFAGELNLKYVRNDQNRGAQFSRNRGVCLTSSQYIAFVDDDDEWLPGKLQQQVDLFEASSEDVGLVYGWADAVNDDGVVTYRYRYTSRGAVLTDLLHACFIPSPTVMVRREAIERVGGFDESLPACQDWDTWVRIIQSGFSIEVVSDNLALYHVHQSNRIGTSPRSLEGYYRFYEKHAPLYLNLGLRKELSEKYRGLAYNLTQTGQRALARTCLQRSLGAWSLNAKSWIRLCQLMVS